MEGVLDVVCECGVALGEVCWLCGELVGGGCGGLGCVGCGFGEGEGWIGQGACLDEVTLGIQLGEVDLAGEGGVQVNGAGCACDGVVGLVGQEAVAQGACRWGDGEGSFPEDLSLFVDFQAVGLGFGAGYGFPSGEEVAMVGVWGDGRGDSAEGVFKDFCPEDGSLGVESDQVDMGLVVGVECVVMCAGFGYEGVACDEDVVGLGVGDGECDIGVGCSGGLCPEYFAV